MRVNSTHIGPREAWSRPVILGYHQTCRGRRSQKLIEVTLFGFYNSRVSHALAKAALRAKRLFGQVLRPYGIGILQDVALITIRSLCSFQSKQTWIVKGFKAWSTTSTTFFGRDHASRQLIVIAFGQFTGFTLLLRLVPTSNRSSPFSLERQHWILVTCLQLVQLGIVVSHDSKVIQFV